MFHSLAKIICIPILCLLLVDNSYAATEKGSGMNSAPCDPLVSRIELINWRQDEIPLYDAPAGNIIGKIVLERNKANSKEKSYFLEFGGGSVDYLLILRAENIGFQPYALVDGEASQKFTIEDHTKFGGTVTMRGGYVLQMRLASVFDEWVEVVIDESTNETVFLMTQPDFRLYQPQFEY